MALIRSPVRTIANSGDVPKFTGVLPTRKAPGGQLVFDSIAALAIAIFLEWCKHVHQIIFEKTWYVFEATLELARVRCLPDFHVAVDGGELLIVEVKSSQSGLRHEERSELKLIEQHFAAQHQMYIVMFHDDLKRNGFIETILFLRPYGLLECRSKVLHEAHARLMREDPLHLEDWRAAAAKARVPVSVLYHLLYHQRLPIIYRMILHTEMNRWRV